MSAGSSTSRSSAHAHCIFCLKPAPPPPPRQTDSSSSVSTTGRAFTLLERHLKLEPPPRRSSSGQDYNNMNVCRSCAFSLETFCGLYEQIKGLELKLEGQVLKLRSEVEHANRVPTRGAFVKQCYQEEEDDDEGRRLHSGIEGMYSWRRSFSRKCLKKLSSNFPKVVLTQASVPARRSISARQPQQNDGSGLGTHKIDFQRDTEIDIKYELPSCDYPCSSTLGGGDDVNDADDDATDASCVAGSPANSPSHDDDDDDDYILPDDEHRVRMSRNPEPKFQRHDDSPPKDIKNPSSSRWCSVCSKLFRTERDFRRHFKSHHDLQSAGRTESQSVKCSECPAYFLTTFQLLRHITFSHRNSKNLIPNPGGGRPPPKSGATTTATSGELIKSGDRYYCSGCPKWFFLARNRTTHFRNYHKLVDMEEGAEVAKCDKPGCSAYFRNLTQLINHKREFHVEGGPLQEKPFFCPQCGDAFNNKYKLLLHRQAKHKEVVRSRYKCEKCGVVLATRSGLWRHLLTHSGPEAYRYQCGTCGKKLIAKDKLARHMRTHSRKKGQDYI